MLEAFDELGIKPCVIAGCSIGALIGAGYAGGMSALEIREHALRLLTNRVGTARHIFGARRTKLSDILSLAGPRSLQLEGAKLADVFLPDYLPKRIEDCPIPLKVIAADYELMEEVVLTSGSLAEAIGASIAIPGVIAAPRINGRLHVDGGVKNPVPFDHAREGADIVVAIDVTGRTRMGKGQRQPSNLQLAIGSMLIMFGELAELRRRQNPPEIYIRPDVGQFRAGDLRF
jgi:NTE family protein